MSQPVSSSATFPSASGSATPESRSTTFQAVEGGTQTRSGETLLITAYEGMWLILMAFLYFMWRRSDRISERIAGLEAAIGKTLHEKSSAKDKSA